MDQWPVDKPGSYVSFFQNQIRPTGSKMTHQADAVQAPAKNLVDFGPSGRRAPIEENVGRESEPARGAASSGLRVAGEVSAIQAVLTHQLVQPTAFLSAKPRRLGDVATGSRQ